MKVKTLIWVIALAAAGYAGYQYFKPDEAVYMYRTQAVTRGTITTSVNATGTVNAVEMVDVGTQVSGTINEIYVDFNSQVKKDQPLALLDTDYLESKVEESRAGLTVARASATRAQAEVASAQRSYERNQELWERKLIARVDVENAETQLSVARAGTAETNSRVLQAQEALRQAETNLNYAKIISPIDGVVISRQVDVGQTVAASLSAPVLFSIAKDLTQMQVEANIDEADIGRIQEGQKAVCTFDSWPDESFDAVVSQKRLSPETISNVVTYVVILQVDNDENKLMPGMTANVSIETERRDNVVKVPAAALRFAPPADALVNNAEQQPEDDGGSRASGGLLPMMRGGRGGEGGGSSNISTVWLVEDGQLAGSVPISETGISDRTWVEIRGDALSQIREGQQLAVAFTKETTASGAAMAGDAR